MLLILKGRTQDFTTYYTDMKTDNVKGDNEEPVWQTLYSAKDCYQLSDLSTNSWHLFINRTLTDDTLTELYYRNYHRNSSQYVKTHPSDTIEWKHNNIDNNKKVNPLVSMLT